MPPAGFFVFVLSLSLSLSVLHLYCFVLIVLAWPFVLIDQHKKHTSIDPAGFEPAIPVSNRPQTLALDRSAAGMGPGFEPATPECDRPQTLAIDHSATRGLEPRTIEPAASCHTAYDTLFSSTTTNFTAELPR